MDGKLFGPTDGSNTLWWEWQNPQLLRFLKSSPQVAVSCPALEKKNVDLKTQASSRSHKRRGLGSRPTLLSWKASKCQTLKKAKIMRRWRILLCFSVVVSGLNLAFWADWCTYMYYNPHSFNGDVWNDVHVALDFFSPHIGQHIQPTLSFSSSHTQTQTHSLTEPNFHSHTPVHGRAHACTQCELIHTEQGWRNTGVWGWEGG